MRRDRTNDERLVVYGANAVLELLRSGAVVERVVLGRGPRHDELTAAARARRIAVEIVDRVALDRLAGTTHHQSAVAVAPPFRYATLPGLLEGSCPSALLLDGIQDPRNLGAILRTARAAGVGGVVIPADRSVGVTSVVASTAAGVLFGLSLVRVPNLVRSMEELKRAGFWTVGLVPDAPQSLYQIEVPSRVALVVGGEGSGLRPLVRRSCDFEVRIPMAPGVESLNAGVATGIALYELFCRPRVKV
jgi:23S rRNA (guanosine2251-2'-O)-methyltransferase